MTRQVCTGSVRHPSNGLAINGVSRGAPPTACWEKAAASANDPKSRWKKSPKPLIVFSLPPPGNDAAGVSGVWERDALPSKTSSLTAVCAFKRKKTTTNHKQIAPEDCIYPGLDEPSAPYWRIPYERTRCQIASSLSIRYCAFAPCTLD